MLKSLKTTVLGFSKATGLFSLAGDSAWRRNRLLVLAYHSLSVEEEHDWNPSLFMSPERFESRMQLLVRNKANVLPFAHALELLRTGGLPPRSVAITFDDGTADFYERAFPLLRRFNFPALVYLTTWYTAFPSPLYHLICPYMLWKRRDRRVHSRDLIGIDREWDLSHEAQRTYLAWCMHDHVRRHRLTPEQRTSHLRDLAERLDLDFNEMLRKRLLQLMTPSEIKDIARNGIDVQLHTHRHRVPSDRRLFTDEILENRKIIELLTGKCATHFCYPSGITNSALLPWLRECDVRTATTCEAGLVAGTTDPLLMPRVVDATSLSELEFESWICGLATLFSNGRRLCDTHVHKAQSACTPLLKVGRWLPTKGLW